MFGQECFSFLIILIPQQMKMIIALVVVALLLIIIGEYWMSFAIKISFHLQRRSIPSDVIF